jgi:hypothetical protein
MEKLLEEITTCENIKKTLNGNFDSDCKNCEKIIKSQKCDNIENFQLPEPWNGDLENCKILFISSNPSFNQDENYPLGDWDKSVVSDFFINRFTSKKKWVKNELYTLQSNDVYSENWVRFWAAVRSIARVILDTRSTTAGKDYALTEIVHCKSKDEEGVQDAMETCADKYLDRIIKITKAKIIICLGGKAADAVKLRYQIETTGIFFESSVMDKVFLFLPHPNAHKERKLNKILTQDDLEKVKNKIK